jgi:anhydro-N-acetylmuramic acid kinase
VQALITAPQAGLREIGGLDVALGRFFGACALSVVRDAGLVPSDLAAIGHHGQTIFHAPTDAEPFSMQLGDPNSVAALTGITTVADFRRRDIAHGGQGAPLVPAFHDWLWSEPRETRVIVNIGGIANVTVIRPRKPTVGFDTGPGNTLLNAWIQHRRGLSYDGDGTWAKSGTVNATLLRIMQREPYFTVRPPKSTGREHFNLAWLESHLESSGKACAAEDVQATLAELTAATIVAAIEALTRKYRLIICGGGASNGDLLMRVKRLSGQDPETTAAYGVPPDYVEAAAFAWLARARLRNKAGNVPSVTGSREAVVLGGIYYGGKPDALARRDGLPSGRAKSKTA